MNCINCNKEIPNGITICPNCGSKTNSSSIIMPTESEPRTMPSGGLNNNNIDIPLIKKEDNTNQVKNENNDNKPPIMIGAIIAIILLFAGFIIFGVIIPAFKSDDQEVVEEVVTETIVGDNEYGYLSLPGDWDEFENEEENLSLQYINEDGWIVTLDAIDQDEEDATAENYAKLSENNMGTSLETIEQISLNEAMVAEYDAYQVTGYYVDDDIWLVEWYFEPGDDKIHYISIEGPQRTSDLFDVVETFSLTEIE